MIKKSISYIDYNGVNRTEDFFFNLSKAEIMAMEMNAEGGMQKRIEKLAAEKDNAKLFNFFDEIVKAAYGEKSEDGRRFVKNRGITEAFTQSEAYSELLMTLLTDENAMSAFINGIVPQDLLEKAKAENMKNASMPVLLANEIG